MIILISFENLQFVKLDEVRVLARPVTSLFAGVDVDHNAK